jgi:hypothetical protein
MKKWMKSTWSVILVFLIVIFISVWLSYSNAVFWKDQQLASASTVTFTMLLAGATILLAFFTYLSVKSGYDREKRYRKERLLNEVISWLRALEKRIFPNADKLGNNIIEEIILQQKSGISKEVIQILHDLDQDIPQIDILTEVIKDCAYMEKISFKLNNKLSDIIVNFKELLTSRSQLIVGTVDERTTARVRKLEEVRQLIAEGKDTSEIMKSIKAIHDVFKKLGDNASSVRDQIKEAIDTAIEIKTEGIT